MLIHYVKGTKMATVRKKNEFMNIRIVLTINTKINTNLLNYYTTKNY